MKPEPNQPPSSRSRCNRAKATSASESAASAGPTRRQIFSASLGALAIGLVRLPASSAVPAWPRGLLGFEPLSPSSLDLVRVAKGYDVSVLMAWGDPLSPTGPAWHPNNTAADQRVQAGMHHDGMYFFADKDDGGRERSDRGVLAVNHEYVDLGLLYDRGIGSHSAGNVRKAQAAVGVSMVRLERDGERQWHRRGGFRVDANTPMQIGGPARGHALMKTPGTLFTSGEHAGTSTHGTLANCSSGFTPWGTYLTCEENFQDFFKRDGSDRTAMELRYGLGHRYGAPLGWSTRYGWEQHDLRFDADIPESRNHANRFGWVVEIDPRDPDRAPIKRTALGRFRHENAAFVVASDGRVAVYMGDDERFQYIYKFVSSKRWNAADPTANRELLDEGTLYVARFDSDVVSARAGSSDDASSTGEWRSGHWIALTPAHPELRKVFGDDQGAICIYARKAADLVGATPMDRPEWLAVPQHQGVNGQPVQYVYCSLTNNTRRRTEQEHPANPRANNMFGHILRWSEDGGDATGESFAWQVFLKAGNRDHPESEHRGDVPAADPRQDFGSPDGLCLDRRGVLWVQTDVSSSTINAGPYRGLGNNQMFAVDPATKEVRRFLTGPRGCEVTGVAQTPDGRTFFVNIQHPGERPDDTPSDPDAPLSTWPTNVHGRPRSATVVIERSDRDDERAIGE